MSNFYVYELWNPLKNNPFYVGKGNLNKELRVYSHLKEAQNVINFKNKNRHKINTILKILKEGYSIDHRIVFETDNEQEAFDKEKELIKQYGRRDKNTGILTNMTDGGEGASGYIFPKWLLEIKRNRMLGANNHMYGKTHSKETRAKISTYLKDGFANGSILPTIHTEAHKKNLRENNKGGQATAIPVAQICIESGNIIKFHRSARQAGLLLTNKKDAKANICAACKNKNVAPYGFYWRYIDDTDISSGKLMNIDNLNKWRFSGKSSKSVIQLDDNYNQIKVWESASEACRSLNKHIGSINRALKNSTKAQGFYWKYN